MAKAKKTVFFCQECGYESPKWMGQCPGCKSWNTFVEETVSPNQTKHQEATGRKKAEPVALSEISLDEEDRIHTGIKELDRVLGGGIVQGSMTLVGGDPGIGKSTLLLQVCRNLADQVSVLYISGEESLKQIKLRAQRIGAFGDRLRLLCETNLDMIRQVIKKEKPTDRLDTDYVQRRGVLCSWKCVAGKRIHRGAAADSKRTWGFHIYRWSCDKGWKCSRAESAGTHGRYSALF